MSPGSGSLIHGSFLWRILIFDLLLFFFLYFFCMFNCRTHYNNKFHFVTKNLENHAHRFISCVNTNSADNWRPNENRDKALVMYVFSTDSQIQELFTKQTSAGSMCCNDTIMQYVGKSLILYPISEAKRKRKLDMEIRSQSRGNKKENDQFWLRKNYTKSIHRYQFTKHFSKAFQLFIIICVFTKLICK